MCGILGVVRRPPVGAPPDLTTLLARIDAAVEGLHAPDIDRDAGALRAAADEVHAVALALRGPLAAGALIAAPVEQAAFERRAVELGERLAAIEARLDAAADVPTAVGANEGVLV